MQADFPAAHSMDSSWYAVDQHGNVALFVTGAGGAVPNDAYSPDNAAMMMEELDDETREELGFSAADVVPEEGLPAEQNLFMYETGPMDESLAERYHRSRVPKNPVHIDELPPQARAALGRMRFDALDFAKTEVFQPIELAECGTWDPAYLAGDGKTVKPVPGREKEYAEFLDERRDEFAGDDLTLEEPPQPRGKSRGKKKGDAGGQ
jgi:hypothetical protein